MRTRRRIARAPIITSSLQQSRNFERLRQTLVLDFRTVSHP